MNATNRRYGLWLCLCLFSFVSPVLSSFVNYSPGYEYLYNLNSTIELKEVQTFLVKGQIGFVNINEQGDFQELLLIVHGLTFSPKGHPEAENRHHIFSKWFSFEISRRGEIRKVYHTADEDDEVLLLKKGFAGMLSGKLHHRHEVDHEGNLNEGWSYKTDELGREGPHNASYTVRKTPSGYEYVKSRNSTQIQSVNGNGTYAKILHFHQELNTIHSVMIEEELNINFSAKTGFDPFYGMRPVHAVSGFSDIGLPPVTASSKDMLLFLNKRKYIPEYDKPQGILTGSIHHTSKIKKRATYQTKSQVKDAKTFIAGNMTCIHQEPEQGSPKLSICFHNLVKTLEEMTESDVEKIANSYFLSRSIKRRVDKNIMANAFIALNNQDVLVNKILNNLQTDESMLMRVLTSLSALDNEPSMELVTTIEKFCFKGKRSETVRLSQQIRHISCLTFGSLVGSLKRFGQTEYAEKLVQYLHDELGLHDPWLFKMKRSTMTEVESVEYDQNKVILLDAIGNAGLSVSYEYIISHVNTTNSQWIKRTGIHALRSFHDARVMLFYLCFSIF